MKAEIWELKLSYSPYDLLLGDSKTIKELYIPILNCSFNFEYNAVNVIKFDENRYKPSSNCMYENIKPVLINTIELNKEQLKLYKKLVTTTHKLGIHNFEISSDKNE